MTIIESIQLAWSQWNGKQKVLIAGIGIILCLIFAGLIFDSAWSSFKVRQAERAAAKAKLEADQAIEKASKIASEIREKEIELKELEKKRDVKKSELEKVKRETADAQTDYERTIREPVNRVPTTDELCSDLAQLGYPCR